jgi:hypothetical protein
MNKIMSMMLPYVQIFHLFILFSFAVTSILIQYDGRMQISKMGLILPYDKLSTLIIIIPLSREASGIQY